MSKMKGEGKTEIRRLKSIEDKLLVRNEKKNYTGKEAEQSEKRLNGSDLYKKNRIKYNCLHGVIMLYER